jgi:hypothetical protein
VLLACSFRFAFCFKINACYLLPRVLFALDRRYTIGEQAIVVIAYVIDE